MNPPTDPPGAFWQGTIQYIVFACEECKCRYFQIHGYEKEKYPGRVVTRYALTCCNCGATRITQVSSEYVPVYVRPGFWEMIPQTMPDVGACC